MIEPKINHVNCMKANGNAVNLRKLKNNSKMVLVLWK